VTWLNTSVHSGFARSASEAMFPRLFPDAGWWCPSLNPAMGGTRLWDLSKGQNWGTLTNMANDDWVTSGGKGALDFDNVDDYVNVPDSEILSGIDFLTISFWANPRTLPPAAQGSRMWAVTKGNTNQFEWETSINAFNNASIPYGKWAFTAYNLAASATRSRGTLADAVTGQWQHVVFTQAGRSSTPDAYYNGTLSNGATISSGTPTAGNGTAPVQIGRRAIGSEKIFDGQLDDIRIYNRALTAGEVRQLWQIGRGNIPLRRRRRYAEQMAGFKAYWARNKSQLIGAGNVSS
jgi:hypothetical protein